MAALPQSNPSLCAGEAVERAVRLARGTHWRLAFLSNTGVTCSLLSDELPRWEDALMHLDGSAGQWVAAFFRQPFYSRLLTGTSQPWHRLRTVIVTKAGPVMLPDTTYERPGPLLPLRIELVPLLEVARRRVLERVKRDFDRMSVQSELDDHGGCEWHFTFYRVDRFGTGNSRQIVQNALASVDGCDVLVW